MISRRHFIGASSVAAAGAALAPDRVLGKTLPQDLPPSIAKLSSWADRATPIGVAERADRVENAKRLMRENDLDALLLTGGTSMVYFTGIRWGLSERLFAVVIPVRGDGFVVTPAFEEDRTREQLAMGPLAAAEVFTGEEHENPYDLVAGGLKARQIGSGRIGAEETVRFVFADGVAGSAPTLEVVSGTPVTAGCRTVKDPHELELMRLANHVTLTAYKAAYEALEEGMTQSDFARLVSLAHSRLGFMPIRKR